MQIDTGQELKFFTDFWDAPYPEDGMRLIEIHLMVDYDQPIEDSRKLGKYDFGDPEITSVWFPTTRTGVSDIILSLVSFNYRISTENMITKLGERGLRGGEIRELLNFGARFPNIQRHFKIVALGSAMGDDFSFHLSPYLSHYNAAIGMGRCLRLDMCGSVKEWEPYWTLFAAVPRESS